MDGVKVVTEVVVRFVHPLLHGAEPLLALTLIQYWVFEVNPVTFNVFTLPTSVEPL